MTQPGNRWITADGCLCWEVWLSDIWLGTGVSLVHTGLEQLLQLQGLLVHHNLMSQISQSTGSEFSFLNPCAIGWTILVP